MEFPSMDITPPSWLPTFTDWEEPLTTDEDRMRLAIAVSRENVERGTGGPFGALIVESDSGRNRVPGTHSAS